MKTTTKTHYRQRITKVMDYIHDHLDGELDVNTLADVALMSPYHFHRIYRELAQETVNATVRRLRLQSAAVELIRSDRSLSSIATMVCYQSLEAFSRAFSKQFGESPGQYRLSKAYKNHQDLTPYIAMLPTPKKVDKTMYTVDIQAIEPTQLIGYSHQGDYMEIGHVFEKLFIDAQNLDLLNNTSRSFGIYYDDPQTVNTNELRSMACISVAADTPLPANSEFETLTIPESKAASLLFKGSYAELPKPYDWFFGTWLPESGQEPADFPAFEEYLNDPKTTAPNELLTRIYCLLKN